MPILAKRFSLTHGLLVSLGLHLAPLAASQMLWPIMAKAPPVHRLELDLHGLVGNDQQVGRAKGASPPPQEQPPLAQAQSASPPPQSTPERPSPQSPQPQQRQSEADSSSASPPSSPPTDTGVTPPSPPPAASRPTPRPSPPKETPSHRSKAPAVPAAPAVPPVAAAPPSPPTTTPPPQSPTEITEDGEQRVQKTLSNDVRGEQFRYVGALVKRLKGMLSFPDEAKNLGLLGRASTTITFAVTAAGDIVPASVRVVRSSGFAVLDDRAIATVIAASPLDPPPPAAMTVTVPLDFMQKQ